MRIAHPTLPKLIDKLQKEQSGNELTLERRLGGESPPPKKKKYRDIDRQLKKIVESYDYGNAMEYLRLCSHKISLTN